MLKKYNKDLNINSLNQSEASTLKKANKKQSNTRRKD